MINDFATDNQASATAALLVYAAYRSRDQRRFKASTDMWAKIERFVKAAAKRAESLPRFLENLKPRLSCPNVRPSTLKPVSLADLQAPSDTPAVLAVLYKETAWVILLVRDRLERERAANYNKENN
ncbi:MAG: hypothetical protein P1P81_09230 [Desulfobulbales bacterium]|nr:hypothetical protein [Desulfobulbales bacterium]